MENTSRLYKARFSQAEREAKRKTWGYLVKFFFQRYIRETDTVLDVGAGYCEFLNSVRAKRKIAVDINEDLSDFAGPGVEVILAGALSYRNVKDSSVDVVFISNLLEHLPSKDAVERALIEAHRVLKTGGSLILLQPNIRYSYKEYWDFFDHITPLSDKSIIEVLLKTGYRIAEIRPRFLPYTTKSIFPPTRFLAWAYLHLGIVQNLVGKQMFVLAKKK